MEIIGAGFGRTGTKSLQLALQQLGFGKCYHMEELFRNPEGVTHWNDAYLEKPVDWSALFANYRSIVDFPGSIYYKELKSYYPDAKVILTVRDPEKWYDSAFRTIFSFDPGPGIKIQMLLRMPFSRDARNLFKVLTLNDKSIWNKFFQGKFKDKAFAIKKFNDHIEEVKNTIPKEDLLIFRSQDGWEPLCEFLGVAVPATPYPSTNKGEDFSEWAKGMVREIISG